MSKITIIYAYWQNQPFGVTWCDLPWALRDAGLAKRLHDDGHDVIESMVLYEGEHPDDVLSGFVVAGDIAKEVKRAREEGEFPIVLCGSCAVAALGAVSGLAVKDLGVVWLDAHPDLSTPMTTVSGLLEGMALSVATGHAWQAMARKHAGLTTPARLDRTVLFGTRDVEEQERRLMAEYRVPVVSGSDEVTEALQMCAETYLHLDMDVHDSLEVRTNAYPAPDGPKAAAVRALITDVPRVSALSVTGLDPSAAQTDIAVELAIGHVLAVSNAWERPQS